MDHTVNIQTSKIRDFGGWRAVILSVPLVKIKMRLFALLQSQHVSIRARTANLQWHQHASRALGGHPVNTDPGLDSQNQRRMYINSMPDLWHLKDLQYFYKQQWVHCSSGEDRKTSRETAPGNKRSLVSRSVAYRLFFLPLHKLEAWNTGCGRIACRHYWWRLHPQKQKGKEHKQSSCWTRTHQLTTLLPSQQLPPRPTAHQRE